VQFNWVKTAKNELDYFWPNTGFPPGFSFFVNSVCLLVRVTMVDKNKAVFCCLLATLALLLSGKKKRMRKIWSMKWCLKRNIQVSCDGRLLNELVETEMMQSWCAQVN
jgi:hypothetical protein